MGVVVGPLSSTSQVRISASTSSGTAWSQAMPVFEREAADAP